MEKLKADLRALPREQQLELHTYLGALLGASFGNAPTAAPAGKNDHWVARVLQAECTALGLGGILPPRAKTAINKHRATIEAYLERACPNETILVRSTVLAMGVRLLQRNLSSMGFTATSSVIAEHLARLPAVFDNAFPGYGQAGMLASIVRKANAPAPSKT